MGSSNYGKPSVKFQFKLTIKGTGVQLQLCKAFNWIISLLCFFVFFCLPIKNKINTASDPFTAALSDKTGTKPWPILRPAISLVSKTWFLAKRFRVKIWLSAHYGQTKKKILTEGDTGIIKWSKLVVCGCVLNIIMFYFQPLCSAAVFAGEKEKIRK